MADIHTLALQALDPDTIWILIPMMALAIPIIALLMEPYKQLNRQRERAEARKLYERLALEKLDVIKTAVAMGFSQDELGTLDARLEKLIGAGGMQGLLDQKEPLVPEASPELLDSDLESELQRLRRKKEKA